MTGPFLSRGETVEFKVLVRPLVWLGMLHADFCHYGRNTHYAWKPKDLHLCNVGYEEGKILH